MGRRAAMARSGRGGCLGVGMSVLGLAAASRYIDVHILLNYFKLRGKEIGKNVDVALLSFL